ncbi:hypothetical protein FOL47_010800 [Perkinsus chesapeaki]|uniref:Uncharacterized protein n=1 Tax=Perkinsus chesapeaki TaxID=330153 RepID=A0A7J6L165_PERCH|nr:hypothetical protein FOL47_010800 [Perkinsus chesapeaki]
MSGATCPLKQPTHSRRTGGEQKDQDSVLRTLYVANALPGRLPSCIRDKNVEDFPLILRHEVCNILQNNPPLQDSWEAECASDIGQAIFRSRGLPPRPTWEQYVSSMRDPKAWAGERELAVIATIFNATREVDPLCIYYDGTCHYSGLIEKRKQ